MTQLPPVRVFIGSGEASCLERKTLIHSLRKTCSRELDIYVFNGTHNSIERNDEEPVLANLPLWIKYQNFTEFSNYRFLIPEICGHEGRAIFLDSDMVCLSDIAEFFDQPMNGHDMLAKAEAYQGESCWGMSQILFDCSKCRFDVEQIFREMEAGEFANIDFHQMRPPFLAKHPYSLGAYDSNWNVFDKCDENTKLIHYTNLGTQPWKFPGHPHEQLWFDHFQEARESGLITQFDLKKTLSRAYCRQDILNPSAYTIPMHGQGKKKNILKRLERKIKKLWRGEKKAA
ncbi:glycosyltransferase family protein [Blastopirellula retiformator]|uniref:Glycosyl transferase family 8 n=1 Tax=Blastopirellula retiformator TaxID=2527970 RepID=A0A5C5UZD4_9BACT|nr:glycosyl transferase [Blastopirellula retiformator]TWT30855.1 Glycosyl transferase family 8 [Blastopirellula retiformator]